MVANANLSEKRKPIAPSTRERSKSWNVPLDELELETGSHPVLAPAPLRMATRASSVAAPVAAPHPPFVFSQARPFIFAATFAVAALLLYFALSTAIGWLGSKADDLQYGRPRTFQTDAFVGHEETAGTPSHFIALNLNQQISIIELPGGDVTKARAIAGPYLFGSDSALTPVRLEIRDINADNKPDLLVIIKNEQVIYINSGSDFRLITADERNSISPK